MNVYECTLVIADGIAETQAVGAAIELQVERVIGTQTVGGSGITDGDKGDVTVSGSGTVWTIDARAITAPKLFEVGANKLLGRHTGTAGDVQEISVDGGLEFHGGQLRRAALTGPVTASAGGNATTLAQNGAATGNYYKWDGTNWVPAVISYLEDIEDIPSTFTPTAHTHALSDLTQSGATTNQIIQWNGTAWVPVTFTAGIGGSTGSTDNALLRADGTGGATAQSSTVTISDTGVITSTFYEISTATFGGRAFTQFKGLGTNVSVQICPTGTGCLSLQMPDGTVTGGNARGNNAVDFTYSRSSAADVASGVGAVAFQKSRATGADSFSIGNGTASGANGFSGGLGAVSSGLYGFSYGFSAAASGNYTFAFGLFANASGLGAWAAGERANAPLHGQFSESAGPFAATGDAQRSRLMARRSTTDATPSNLFLDGSSARVLVPANSSGVAMITVVARTNTAGDQHMTWRRRVNWERGVAVGTVTVDVETMGTDRGYTGGAWGAGPAWTLAITADTTNGAINIIGTGAAATNIRWVADMEWVETTFA
jgi:hypothetical protein